MKSKMLLSKLVPDIQLPKYIMARCINYWIKKHSLWWMAIAEKALTLWSWYILPAILSVSAQRNGLCVISSNTEHQKVTLWILPQEKILALVGRKKSREQSKVGKEMQSPKSSTPFSKPQIVFSTVLLKIHRKNIDITKHTKIPLS